ncbi:hypothetical protein BU17DRAFT_70911 [Hysterangium stoloniferum]|nr:hypothetical protein BU17DRAFT_70911 [Hysterangium stoloniferum]
MCGAGVGVGSASRYVAGWSEGSGMGIHTNIHSSDHPPLKFHNHPENRDSLKSTALALSLLGMQVKSPRAQSQGHMEKSIYSRSSAGACKLKGTRGREGKSTKGSRRGLTFKWKTCAQVVLPPPEVSRQQRREHSTLARSKFHLLKHQQGHLQHSALKILLRPQSHQASAILSLPEDWSFWLSYLSGRFFPILKSNSAPSLSPTDPGDRSTRENKGDCDGDVDSEMEMEMGCRLIGSGQVKIVTVTITCYDYYENVGLVPVTTPITCPGAMKWFWGT